ncbi:hypothetical protein [Bifidobacterium longum]|uniref:hypothetical protein n=1 Tax=Bifidobacterium longum TaxID=216816 RepID=UPI0012BB1627|nr:hypothetical protein [Bifidobacterium longum]MBL3901056.1 hypothetical protein [Bifidobacterium longum subsp. longum]MBL3904927.1 hypothetical protein [Bifidobacterium longum subsp. longum]MBV3463565.1 hypothetical protein [Bifidobacterium longum]MBV3530345.1 hypothetical protein [Bifidobacterium longum]MBV3808980.1 hypothetical protein [Bifidobacterium longum]
MKTNLKTRICCSWAWPADSRLLFSFLLILLLKEKQMAGKRDFVGKWPFWDGVGPKHQ